jgi:hypothetical protein
MEIFINIITPLWLLRKRLQYNYVIMSGVASSIILVASLFTPSSQFSQHDDNVTNAVTGIGATNQTEALAISIAIAKNPTTRDSEETITVKVSDAISNQVVVGASVDGEVKYVDSTVKRFFNITDGSGQVSYNWIISGDSTPGTFTVTAQSSAAGYPTASNTTTFEVIPASASP